MSWLVGESLAPCTLGFLCPSPRCAAHMLKPLSPRRRAGRFWSGCHHSQSYRITEICVGRSLKDHLVPAPCHGLGCHPLGQAAQSPIHLGPEHPLASFGNVLASFTWQNMDCAAQAGSSLLGCKYLDGSVVTLSWQAPFPC